MTFPKPRTITSLIREASAMMQDECAKFKNLEEMVLRESAKNPSAVDILHDAAGKLDSMINEIEIYKNGVDKMILFLQEQSKEVHQELQNFNEGLSYVEHSSHFNVRHLAFEEAAREADEFGVSTWADDFERIEEMTKLKDSIWNFDKSMHFKHKEINNYRNTNLGFKFKIPTVHSLDHIPESMYYYDNKEDSGIYICITKGTYVRIPLPDVSISALPESVQRCKYTSQEDCINGSKSSNEILERLRSKTKCNKVHTGGTYVKTKFPGRCDGFPEFGNRKTLHADWKKVPAQDVKMMLMYSLSDLLLAACWLQQSNTEAVMKNVDRNV